MKRPLYFSLALTLFLGACHAAPSSFSSPPPSLSLYQQNASQTLPPLTLPLSAALRQELQAPENEPEPRNEIYNEAWVQQVLAPDLSAEYVHAHSYYFDHLDSDGHSTVERILQHDGQTQAATWVEHWRSELGQAAVWPDRNSTTYTGRFTALEHGQVGPHKGWFNFKDARSKAQEYYQLALEHWRPGLPPNHPDQSEAWAWLGRASHFVQDMSVPFHSKSMIRPAQPLHHHSYELSCEHLFENYFPSQNYNPFGVWEDGPYPAQGQWGLYFPPGTTADAVIMQVRSQAEPFYKLVDERENERSGNWEKSRAVLIPLGAKATAGLVVEFLRQTGALT